MFYYSVYIKNMKYFLLIIFISLLNFKAYSVDKSSDLLDNLKNELNKKSEYEHTKELRITNLKTLYARLSKTDYAGQFNVLNKLYNEYKSYHADSAYVYVNKMVTLSLLTGNKAQEQHNYVKLAFILLSSGMFMETLEVLQKVDVNALSSDGKVDYYLSLARCNYELANYSEDNRFTPRYLRAGDAYIDSAILFCAREKMSCNYLFGLKNIRENNFDESKARFERLLSNDTSISRHLGALVSSSMAAICLANKDRKEGRDLMIQAVISDVKSSIKETMSLYTLAELLYEEGNINDAYSLIKVAKADADFYGARQRKLQVGKILPLIAEAKLNHSEHLKTRMWVFLLVLAVVTLSVLFFLVKLGKRFTKLNSKQRKIDASNFKLTQVNDQLLKDASVNMEYLGQFCKVISDYITKLEKLSFSLKIKPATHRNEIIYDLINNLDMKKERHKMYCNFDHMFMQLFPNFITAFNSMFEEKDQIWPAKGQILNTDLRIFALIRIGIKENEAIAKILEYSDSTVYVYRMKIKAKSKYPDQFEERIMNIKATDVTDSSFNLTPVLS